MGFAFAIAVGLFELITAVNLIEFIAIMAVAVAYWQIRAQRKLAKQNNSINKMRELQGDGNLGVSMNLIAEMLTHGEQVKRYASLTEWDNVSRKKSHALRDVVEYFELISIGILHNIYDKEIIRASARATFVEMYKRTKPFVLEIRRAYNHPTYGKNFQRVTLEFRSKNQRKK